MVKKGREKNEKKVKMKEILGIIDVYKKYVCMYIGECFCVVCIFPRRE